MSYEDKILACQECGQPFTFTAEDQSFHALKGFTNEPKRCTSCRQNRRTAQGNGSTRVSPEMHPVVCAQCGKDTTVPFKPRGDRPVYCSDCFQQQRAAVGASR